MNLLDQLKQFTTIVADTGDFEMIEKYSPTDATTNPSLILAAAKQKKYHSLIEDAINYAKTKSLVEEGQIEHAIDKLFVNFGKEILKIIPGRVSIEIDASLSYSSSKSIEKAEYLISLFEKENINKNRILIKLAATWEGIQAAKILEKMGIHCNMTLIFSLIQAIACANSDVCLISPFVGRILDWYKIQYNVDKYLPNEDPGVISVTQIYNYYKKYNCKTQIMGASFRNTDQIIELAGCDLLTISPSLLDELKQSTTKIMPKLNQMLARNSDIEKIDADEKTYHLQLKDNLMAFQKLHEGIEKFKADTTTLKELIKRWI